MQYLYSNYIDFKHQNELGIIDACIDLSSLSLPYLTTYLTVFLVRRINLLTIHKIAPYFKDACESGGDSVMQNVYRACKKWIAVNFDYYQKTI
jgi:hypothetical protein